MKKQGTGHRPTRMADTCKREQLIALAPGCIRPTGWAKTIAEIECAGWMEMIVRKDPWNFRESFNDGSPTPHGGEWAGYWNNARIGLALVTGNPDRLQEVEQWINHTVTTAKSREKVLSEYYNGWGAHLMVQGLMTWYEYTGNQEVLELCHRVALELLDDLNSPDGTAFAGDHPVNMASSCAQIYSYTGDKRMLEMADEIMARFDYKGLPNLRRLLEDDRLAGHCVNYCEDIRHPAEVYLASGNIQHLRASERGVELTRRDHLQVQGAPSGNEPVYGKGPLKETEHCDTVEWSFVGHALLAATGDAKYADLAEAAIFNAWAGSRKPDARSLCYNSSPNQITASSWEGTWLPRMNYSPYHDPQCCNLNSHRALHPYVFRMWMLHPDGGLTAVYYGGCNLKVDVPGAGEVEIVEETDYPFDEDVRITINPQVQSDFPIRLRIPEWCSEAQIKVNGEPVTGSPEAGTFFTLHRTWNVGDVIDIRLPMRISLQFGEVFEEPVFKDSGNGGTIPESRSIQVGLREVDQPIPGQHLVAVRRSPLVYTLYIKPQRTIIPDDHNTEGYVVEDITPAHDAGPWNVALVLDSDRPEDSFTFTKLAVPDGSAPFEHAPVGLRCAARIVPDWKAAGTHDQPVTTVPDLPVSASGDPVEALLVPFGCTDIRLTWLPFISHE